MYSCVTVASVACNEQETPLAKWHELTNTGVLKKSGKSTKLIVLWTRDRDNPKKPWNSNDYCNLNISGSCILTRKVKQYKVSCNLMIVWTFMFGHAKKAPIITSNSNLFSNQIADGIIFLAAMNLRPPRKRFPWQYYVGYSSEPAVHPMFR